MIKLENDTLVMTISTLGAEPQSLVMKETGCEYIWNGNPEYWFRHAPLLFPMTGPTPQNKISFKGVEYEMPGNGFARDTEFTVIEVDDNHAVFLLEDSPATRKYYPFAFELTATYTLLEDGFKAEATVKSKDNELWYTYGWHPAFSLDMNGKGTPIEAYRIEFPQPQTSDRQYPINGVFTTEKDFVKEASSFQITREETDKGPIILRSLDCPYVTLACDAGPHGVVIDRGGMDTLVVWTCAPKHAQYVCVEPMCSFGDTSRPMDISQMKEMTYLKPGQQRSYCNSFKVF